jgi:hypothetical protein
VEKVSQKEGLAALRSLFEPFLEAEGVTPESLAHFTAEQLKAEETKLIKVKKSEYDAIKTVKEIPSAKIIYETGEEILFAVNLRAWGSQGEAADRAHKLRGDFIDRHEVSGPGGGPLQFSDLDRANRLAHLIELASKRQELEEKKELPAQIGIGKSVDEIRSDPVDKS